MPDRQLVLSFPLDVYDWLRACAEADGCPVSDVVRRCVVFAQQSCEPLEEDTGEALAAQHAEALRRQYEEEDRRKRAAAIAQKRAELEALERGEDPAPPAQFYTPAPGQPPVVGKPSVLDMDLSGEPRAEEMEIPPDPDEGYAAPPPQRRPQVAQEHETFLNGAPVVPSGQRPGAATRPAGVNRDLGIGLRSGDAGGNVVRANYAHLGFSRSGG